MSPGILKKDEIRRLLEARDSDELKLRLGDTDPADAADLLEELDSDELEQIFSILDAEVASEVIVEMDSNDIDDVVETLPPERLAGMIAEMAPDDAADFFSELDKDEQAKVWHLLDKEDKQELRSLLNYEEDSAGGIMTPELCAVAATATVQQAFAAIAENDFSDPISMIFVVDNEQKLLGSISISELIVKPKNALMKDVAEPPQAVAEVNEDQEDIANDFRKYDLYVMPVVDENYRLVGRITADDVMDVMHEEASEDFAHIAGAPDIEHNEDSPLRIVRMRLPWLMITLFTGMLISAIVQKIIGLKNAESLAAFVPVVLAMGGNTGMQASTVTIRSIALGEIGIGKLLGVLSREILVGFIMGVICGLLVACVVYFALHFFPDQLSQPPLRLSVIIGASMCAAMTFAAVAGSMMPILLNQLNIDPAVASGPFVTTGNDLSASLIYLLMCYILLSI